MSDVPQLNRRRLIGGAAVGGLSLPLLAACGGGGDSASTAGGTASTSKAPSSGGSSGSADVLVATADVPVGEGVILKDQNVVVTQPTKGTFQGFSATCTHEGCQLSTVAAGTINCGCHGSQFNITDGSNVTGPSGTAAGSVPALPKVAVKVQGANVVEA